MVSNLILDKKKLKHCDTDVVIYSNRYVVLVFISDKELLKTLGIFGADKREQGNFCYGKKLGPTQKGGGCSPSPPNLGVKP